MSNIAQQAADALTDGQLAILLAPIAGKLTEIAAKTQDASDQAVAFAVTAAGYRLTKKAIAAGEKLI